MGKKNRQERLMKALRSLVWSDQHWLFVTDERDALDRLIQLGQTPEVRQWGGQLESFFVDYPVLGIWGLFVGGIPKALLPPHVMSRLLDRVHIAYTSRWLAGLAPIMFLCHEVHHVHELMQALADCVGETAFRWTGDVAVPE